MKTVISTSKAPAAIGPYSQAIRKGDTLYLSGQIGMVPATGELVSDDVKEQTAQALANMKAILGGKGANLAEMANIGLPVPPGFTISCQTCMEYANSNNTWPEGVLDTIQE